jgi:glycosyltransferase involved in cell wall biosynthesis
LKKVILSVTNDLVTDSRVHKVALSLQKMSFQVLLVGRKLPKSKKLDQRPYKTHRMKLFFRRGPLFYAEYNFRLFLFLRVRKADIFLANDLDSLLANYLASKLKGKPLVYDSHEFFTEVPELLDRPVKRAIWQRIERAILPKLKYAYTVSESIAAQYREKYGTPFRVVRNLPHHEELILVPHEKNLVTDHRKIILYQGALNIGRGLEYAIKAMQYLDDARLLIAGDGDITMPLKQLVADLKLADRVRFLGKIPLEEMKYITAQADLGLSIEEDLGLNYRFALPNKLFDYIQQQVPVLVSNLPEMKKIVDDYQIGMILESHDPQQMANQFHEALFNWELREKWYNNLPLAAHDLCWENEEQVLFEIFEKI